RRSSAGRTRSTYPAATTSRWTHPCSAPTSAPRRSGTGSRPARPAPRSRSSPAARSTLARDRCDGRLSSPPRRVLGLGDSAIFLLREPGVSEETRDFPPGPGPREPETLSSSVSHLLEEARLLIPGAQALIGFQLVAVFNSRFSEVLDRTEQTLHLLAV